MSFATTSTINNRGYALPMVLVAMAVLLLFLGIAHSRTTREARLSVVRLNSERAYLAAEAGFNRARIHFTLKGHLNDFGVEAETLYDSTGKPMGSYTIEITQLSSSPPEYSVLVQGTAGTGAMESRRTISATMLHPEDPPPLFMDGQWYHEVYVHIDP